MKKILVIGLISGLCSTGAFAGACSGDGTAAAAIATPTAATEQCACNGGNAGTTSINGGAGALVATPVFIKTGFVVQCSANTIVSYNEQSPSQFAVASGSRKGNQAFKGSSAGGGIAVDTGVTCPSSGCTGALVSSALAHAVADTGS